jgi:hypothetical protein
MADGEAQTNASGTEDYWLDDPSKRGEKLPITKLSESYERAYLQACRSTWQADKRWGPSRRQRGYEEPPCKDEQPQKEILTIKSGLSAVNQNLANRHRQIESLKKQIAVTKGYVAQEDMEAEVLQDTLSMAKDPLKRQMVQDQRHKQQQLALEKANKDLEIAKAEAVRYKNLAKQQNAFFLQTRTIYDQERGPERISRFPAGDIFLVPEPLPMDDAKAECDIGTSIANPYEVDSWPFEPNVLARRCSQECPMDQVQEETLEDLVDAQRPGRTNPFLGPGLNLPGRFNDDDDDDDEDYDGPSATSRSL